MTLALSSSGSSVVSVTSIGLGGSGITSSVFVEHACSNVPGLGGGKRVPDCYYITKVKCHQRKDQAGAVLHPKDEGDERQIDVKWWTPWP